MDYIGITGRKRVGKDTAAKILQKELGYDIIAFGDPVKEAMIGVDLKGIAVKRRELYVKSGEEDHRELNLHITIHEAYDYISKVLKKIELDVYFTERFIYNILRHYEYYSFRRLMQIIATDIVQNYNKLYWVEKVLKRIEERKLTNGLGGVIVSDIRFEHEYEAIKEKNGKVIKITKESEENDEHESEQQDISYCIEVVNPYNPDTLDDTDTLEKFKELLLKEIR